MSKPVGPGTSQPWLEQVFGRATALAALTNANNEHEGVNMKPQLLQIAQQICTLLESEIVRGEASPGATIMPANARLQ